MGGGGGGGGLLTLLKVKDVVVLIVLCLGVELLCCYHLMCVFIFLVKFGWLSGHLLGKWLPIRLTVCFLSIST